MHLLEAALQILDVRLLPDSLFVEPCFLARPQRAAAFRQQRGHKVKHLVFPPILDPDDHSGFHLQYSVQ